MNLHYLLSSSHWSLTASVGIAPDRLKSSEGLIEGVRFKSGEMRTLRVAGASEASHFSAGIEDSGWTARLLGKREHGEIAVSFANRQEKVRRTFRLSADQNVQLLLPSILSMQNPFFPSDLLIDVHAEEDVFIGTSTRVSREPLYRLAKGVGIEIGPGPNPQIRNSETTSVSFIEEKPAAEWAALYRDLDSKIAWNDANYRIGKAHELPVEDGSLDFIFSSHVFEHLYNPLGHLAHWRAKLKPGGYVLAVVPCADGTKDFVQPATNVIELALEKRSGSFVTPLAVYERWVRHHQPHAKDVSTIAKSYWQQGFSIHVHVYDFLTANQLLRYCVNQEGFKAFRMHYKRNSKDFIFALQA